MKLIRSSLLTVVVALLFSISVHAGGAFEWPENFIGGVKSDDTIDPGSTLTFKMDDLVKAESDFENAYKSGKVYFYWTVTDTDSFSETGTNLTPYYNSSSRIFSQSVDPEYAGKYFVLHSEGEYNGQNFNHNTKFYKVNSTNVTVDITPKVSYQNPNVIVTWTFNSKFVSGSYIERQDTSTKATVKLGNVSSDYSYQKYTDSTAVKGKTYKYRVVSGTNYTNWSSSVSIPNTTSSSSGGSSSSSGGKTGSSSSSSSSSGSGSSFSGGSSSSGSVSVPSLSDGRALIYSSVPGVANISLTGYGYGIGIEVYKGNSKIADKLLGYYGSADLSSAIPYGTKTTFKYRIYKNGSPRAYSQWATATISSAKLRSPSLAVTKIAKTTAGLKWSSVSGATGYRVYKGNKLIKTLGKKKTAYIYKGKGAASAKYKVAAIIKTSGMKKEVAGPPSKYKKGKPNVRTYGKVPSVKSYKYGVATFKPTKISLSGNTYTVTGYAINNRMFDLVRFKKLDIILYCNGKKVGRKVFKNMQASCKAYGKKKITFKIKGKGGVDFRNAEGVTIHWNPTPYWKTVGAKAF